MAIRVKTTARQAAEEPLAMSLKEAIAAQLTVELSRALSEAPLKDELARVVKAAIADVVRGLGWGNGRPGVAFSKR